MEGGAYSETRENEAWGRQLELGQLAKKVHVANLGLDLRLVLEEEGTQENILLTTVSERLKQACKSCHLL
jgi:hypothetical protein